MIINCAKDDEEVNGTYSNVRPESNNNITIQKVKSIDSGDDIGHNQKPKEEKKDELAPQATTETVRTTLVEVLAAACGEKILNPDFLLQGGGQPFADQQNQQSKDGDHRDSKLLLIQQQQQLLKDQEAAEIKAKAAALKEVKKELETTKSPTINITSVITTTSNNIDNKQDEMDEPKQPIITLYSQKMKGLKELLLAEKLNTHAISLQVTAQSQVQVGGKKNRHAIGSFNYSTSKRSRRE